MQSLVLGKPPYTPTALELAGGESVTALRMRNLEVLLVAVVAALTSAFAIVLAWYPGDLTESRLRPLRSDPGSPPEGKKATAQAHIPHTRFSRPGLEKNPRCHFFRFGEAPFRQPSSSLYFELNPGCCLCGMPPSALGRHPSECQHLLVAGCEIAGEYRE